MYREYIDKVNSRHNTNVMYNVHCTLYTVQCTMYNVQYTLYNVQCTIYTVHCTLYNVQCTLYTLSRVNQYRRGDTSSNKFIHRIKITL